MNGVNRNEVVITRYRNPGANGDFRVALITDLHNCEYGQLLVLLKQEQPDFILCVGDILERHEEGSSEWTIKTMERWQTLPGKKSASYYLMWLLDRITERNGIHVEREADKGLEFLKEASDVAPVYYSVGNHEWYFTPSDYHIFADNHITLLDNADCIMKMNGQQFTYRWIVHTVRYGLVE